MPSHELKSCPRCGAAFECKVGDISSCQCQGVALTADERAFIEERYADCLCIGCLKELKNRYVVFSERFLFRK
jgi:Cysteine-rich CWC